MPPKRHYRVPGGARLRDDMAVTLVYGGPLAAAFRDGREPPIEAQREAWARHRASLMKPEVHDLPPGCRPAGFWLFDLHIDPPPDRWATEIPELIERGLIDAAEAARIEAGYQQLAARHPVHEAVGTYKLPEDSWTLRRRLEEARCAAAWHAWQGRERQAASWAAFAEEIQGALRGLDTE